MSFLADVRDLLIPWKDPKQGPLPPMLVAMTLVTGLVDAFSLLVLNHVFVANMTGNVVFLALALAGAKGFSILSSVIALAAFICGTIGGGRLLTREAAHRGRMLTTSSSIQAILLGATFAIVFISGEKVSVDLGYFLLVPLAISMGMQNALARKLAVPDLTTTVLTMTMVGIGADSRAAGGKSSRIGRRITPIVAMFLGALIGALMIVYSSIAFPLLIAFLVVAFISASASLVAKKDGAWIAPKQD